MPTDIDSVARRRRYVSHDCKEFRITRRIERLKRKALHNDADPSFCKRQFGSLRDPTLAAAGDLVLRNVHRSPLTYTHLMSHELKKRIQLVLIAAFIVAGARAAYIFHERHSENATESGKQAPPPLNPDYYVSPKKLYPYDLKSAKQLTKQPVWVKEGYRYTYYPYDTASHRTDFGHEGGQLLPIEKLDIKDVVTDVTPGAADQKQVMAVFEKEGKRFAFPIGLLKGGTYQIYSDEMLFIQDPHELYNHWPAETWTAISNHEMKPGMNELQASFSIGMGVPEASSDPAVKTVKYPNGGKPVTVTYRNGKAAEITGS